MLTPKETQPEQSSNASAEKPADNLNLEKLTPHPEEFQQLTSEVIHNMHSEKGTDAGWRSPKKGSTLQKFGLKAKVTLGALALGVLPVLAIGGVAVTLAEQSFESKIRVTEQARAEELADRINRFIFERFADVVELLIGVRKVGRHFLFDPLRSADPGDDVFTLSVAEVVAAEARIAH